MAACLLVSCGDSDGPLTEACAEFPESERQVAGYSVNEDETTIRVGYLGSGGETPCSLSLAEVHGRIAASIEAADPDFGLSDLVVHCVEADVPSELKGLPVSKGKVEARHRAYLSPRLVAESLRAADDCIPG